ncbi:MAG: LysR family transcriptional regulator [Clostridia bacterium]|jgi:transcriptional regulatory protein|uniref:LysR family transcriptional regulator n=1 Tax=Candidatus Merdicola sp. TaxID=3085652 RepID=UPI002FABC553
MINLELYKIFVFVAKEGNITKASEKLNISQPAVTKHIKNLEEQLGVTLFKRNKYGMELTDKGRELYKEVSESILKIYKAEERVRSNRNIHLGSHVTMLSRMFGKCIADYYELNPNSQIEVTNETFNDMLNMLENQKLDIVLSKKVDESVYNTNKIEFIKLGLLHDIFVINTNSRYKDIVFSKEKLAQEKIYAPKKTSLTSINLMKELKLTADTENIKNITYTTMLGILKTEDSIGIITKEYIKDELEGNKLAILKTDFEFEPMEFGIYINKENKFKELKDLIKIMKNEFLQV